MSVSRIASRYARSLIELAQETGRLDRVLEDMNLLQSMLRNRDLRQMLKSPVITEDKKTAVLKQILNNQLDDLSMKFVLLLVKKNREPFLRDIIQEFIEQYKEIRKIFTLKLQSATPMDEEEIEHLKKRLRELGIFQEGTIEVEQEIDPDLIGGFILEYKDFIYDASVSHKLNEMRRKQFHGNLYRNRVLAR